MALVTGASSGLGRAYAVSLARRGHPLLLAARRQDRLTDLAAFCERRFAVIARTVACDLSTPEGLAACRRAADAGPVGVAVLNAGFGSVGAFAGLDRAREDRMVLLNCLAVVDLARHVLPGMLARGRGDLVVVSSAAAFRPLPGMATYAATKAFELHLARALSAEVHGTGVRVLAVCPGPTRSAFSEVITAEGARTGRGGTWPWWLPLDDPEDVVDATWRALDRGRDVVATGRVSRAMRLLAPLVPAGPVRRVAAHRGRPAGEDGPV